MKPDQLPHQVAVPPPAPALHRTKPVSPASARCDCNAISPSLLQPVANPLPSAIHRIPTEPTPSSGWRCQSVGPAQGTTSAGIYLQLNPSPATAAAAEPNAPQGRAKSAAATPDRERRGSFSYLSLLSASGSYGHRTQSVGGPQVSRRKSSLVGHRSESLESLTATPGLERHNLLVRTNPIGLVEPSLKRDGYAVGTSTTDVRVSSGAEARSTEWQSGSRRSSTDSTHGNVGIRLGGGLIQPGRTSAVKHFYTPFGSVQTSFKRAGGSSMMRSQAKKSCSTSARQNSYEEDSSKAATSQASTINCTVTLARARGRSQSMSKQVTSLPDRDVTLSLPTSRRTSVDRELAASTVGLRRSSRSSSMEVFDGTFAIKMSSGSSQAANSHTRVSKVSQIRADHFILRSDQQQSGDASDQPEVDDGPHVDVTLTGIRLRKAAHSHTSPESGRGGRSSVTKVDSQALSKKEEEVTSGMSGIGDHLRGLDQALEALALQQKAQLINLSGAKCNGGSVTSVTVSLPASRRASRRNSVDLSGAPAGRSRRNSLDIYSADYSVKLGSGGPADGIKMEMTSSCHIQVEDRSSAKVKLCCRCHHPDHRTEECREFGDLSCPRCLEWSHWEDTCPADQSSTCKWRCPVCQELGHGAAVHQAVDFKQRRAIVDTLGWQPFQEWFYQSDFRSWWQLNGCVGVPLYKIYRRTSQWRTHRAAAALHEPAPDVCPAEEDSLVSKYLNGHSSLEDRAAYLSEKYQLNYKLKKAESIEELTPPMTGQRPAPEVDSGRSTPEYLKKYSPCPNRERKRPRTFSETLKLLDQEILAELDMK